MARDIYGNPILRYGQASPIIPSTVRLTQSPAANPYDPRATYQGDLQTELGVVPQLQRPMVSPVLGRPSVAREGAIMRGAMTPAQSSALATQTLAETARERAIRQSAMGAAQQQRQQRPKGFFDSLPSPMSPAGQALGAFGSTALQLSGWPDRPMTLGAGLGAAVQAAQEAYTTAQEKEAKTALAKQQRDIEAANRAQDLAIKMLEIQATQARTEREEKGKAFTEEKALRDTLDKRSKDFDEALMGFQKVQRAALAEPSGANDIALIFGFMKTIDPTSVVREGEFATAEQAGGVGSQVLNLYNRAVSGERLPDNVRKKFVDAAREQFAPALERQRGLEQGFTDLAERYELDPTKIVLSRIPKQGSMTMPYSVATEEEAQELPSGSYVYINGRLARID